MAVLDNGIFSSFVFHSVASCIGLGFTIQETDAALGVLQALVNGSDVILGGEGSKRNPLHPQICQPERLIL